MDDVYAACDSIREMGYGFMKEPDGGTMKGLAFAYDPDGYLIEIIKLGGIDFGDKKVETWILSILGMGRWLFLPRNFAVSTLNSYARNGSVLEVVQLYKLFTEVSVC